MIAQLAYDVAEKQTAVEGDLVVTPSDQHFWFGRPRIILHLIHFILFQNAFELAFFFWILVTTPTKHYYDTRFLILKCAPSDAHD